MMNSQEKLEEIRKTVVLHAPLEKVWQAVLHQRAWQHGGCPIHLNQ